MSEKRSIQDIVPPARSKPIRPRLNEDTHPSEESPKLPLRTKRTRAKSGMFGMLGIALAVLLVIGAAFALVSTVFHRATVTFTPYVFSVSVAETYAIAPDGENLSYQTVSFEETRSKNVPSTSSQHVEDRAQGTVTIYNEYSTQAQRLITNTRFEAENGLIYRIKSPVTVPGYTTSGGKKVPGSIETTVYADEVGDSYNIAPNKFTIPGLAGSPQFDSMYARSNASMTGGFVGQKAVVEEAIRTQVINELKSELDRTARAGLSDKVLADQFFLSDTLTVEFIEQPDRAVDSGAEITVKAVASAPVFSDAQLATLIASAGGVSFDAPLKITNRDQLMLQIEKTSGGALASLVVSGDASLVSIIDTDKFVREVAGKDQKSVGSVLVRYPGIKDLNLSVYPFWRQTLPENPSKFTVEFGE